MTTLEKALVATMAAVIILVAAALLSLPIPPDGPGLYDDELPNPSRLTLDDNPVYEPDCQTKILSRLKK